MVVTDGESSDVDVFDPDYLLQDARYTVQELRATGIQTYCLSLDPRADRYMGTIFGRNHYGVVDHLARLPERRTGPYLAQTAVSLTLSEDLNGIQANLCLYGVPPQQMHVRPTSRQRVILEN